MNSRLGVVAALGVLILAVGCQKGTHADKAASESATQAQSASSDTAQASSTTAEKETASTTSKSTSGASKSGNNGLTLYYEDNAKAVDMRQGQTLVVVLDANHSSGYKWALIDKKLSSVAQDGSPAYAAPSGKQENGTETWRFRAVHPGEELVRFEYGRGWGQPDRTFRFTAKVQ